MPVQYFDRTGRALSRREAFEVDGKTLRDGISMRVPHHLADSGVRLTDARAFWDANRDSLVDPRRVGGTQGNAPGYRVFDSDVGRADREAAYAEHEAYLRDAWRGDAAKPRRDPKDDEDDEDDDDDMPQGELEQMTSATDRRTVDQMSRDHQQRMSKIYAEHSLWLANQYKSKG